ncbi:MAG: hypothetical protein ACM319_02990, partial [Deltaproteobacteria bacterium]
MTLPSAAKTWPGSILPVTLPAAPGGAPVTVGGQNALPMVPEGDRTHRAAVGMEVVAGVCELPPTLAQALGGREKDPVELARACMSEWGAQFLFLSLTACHPDGGGLAAEKGARIARDVLEAVSCPAIVGGCG